MSPGAIWQGVPAVCASVVDRSVPLDGAAGDPGVVLGARLLRCMLIRASSPARGRRHSDIGAVREGRVPDGRETAPAISSVCYRPMGMSDSLFFRPPGCP